MSDFTLAAFDGDLAGNEGRIMARLPVLLAPDGRKAVARYAYWSANDPQTLTWLRDDDEVGLLATEVVSSGHLTIQPGDLVVVVGPQLLRDLDILGFANVFGDWHRTSNDGRYHAMPEEQYKRLVRELSESAIARFDREFEQSARSHHPPTPLAAALRVLRGISTGTPSEHVRRRLAVIKRFDTPEAYTQALELAADRLALKSSDLDHTVEGYVDASKLDPDRGTVPPPPKVLVFIPAHDDSAVAKQLNNVSIALAHHQFLWEAMVQRGGQNTPSTQTTDLAAKVTLVADFGEALCTSWLRQRSPDDLLVTLLPGDPAGRLPELIHEVWDQKLDAIILRPPGRSFIRLLRRIALGLAGGFWGPDRDSRYHVYRLQSLSNALRPLKHDVPSCRYSHDLLWTANAVLYHLDAKVVERSDPEVEKPLDGRPSILELVSESRRAKRLADKSADITSTFRAD